MNKHQLNNHSEPFVRTYDSCDQGCSKDYCIQDYCQLIYIDNLFFGAKHYNNLLLTNNNCDLLPRLLSWDS